MAKTDLHRVNVILSKSFTHARIKAGYHSERIPLCRIEFLEMYLAANPEGAFVIEKDGELIAYCFSRLWGTVGWIGPLSVIPKEQGQGYGKNAISTCIDFLKQEGAQTIGLEMPVHSSQNLGFYTKLRFVPDKPTVDLIRPVFPAKTPEPPKVLKIHKFSKLAPTEQPEFLQKMKQFSDRLEPGLDYTREVEVTTEFAFGDACLFTQAQKTVGFVLAHTEAYSMEEERQFLKVNVLQMSPELPISALDHFLAELEDWARVEYLTGIYIRVPTRYYQGYHYLLSKEFKIVNIDLRLTLDGFAQIDDSKNVNFNKWE
jgi:GNAT superfamily N-acetyltransferase